ncbi:hypothetical protein KR76_01910 [Pimelobacter simplex]|uniref:Uncharacterized protein n=2 Tax=Nocardioides simplex TaxID=2045 RepID=A0A0A1DF54_NOCSI|nr:hypothetical protein KR76_01910 [Pimelobacter simplex]GEB16676.1 hypothetical protein NSI01_49910 [Pimelobacter simplex]
MLWKSITDDHELDGPQVVQLTEACRMKDRCDKLDELLRGDVDAWATLVPADMVGVEFKLQIVGALSKANETANSMKQLIAALRLPDPATGKRPQHRGPRGAQKPTVPGGADGAGKVSSIDRARERAARKSG